MVAVLLGFAALLLSALEWGLGHDVGIEFRNGGGWWSGGFGLEL